MKRSTKREPKKAAKKLDLELCRIIRGSRGMAAQIAEIMHSRGPGKPNRAFVWRVINQLTPPSPRFLLAYAYVLDGAKRRVNGALLRSAHPEIDDATWISGQVQRHNNGGK